MPRSTNDPLYQPMPTVREIAEAMNLEGTSPQSRTNGQSVISPHHPDNARRFNERDSTRSYTFRKRDTKLNFTLGWELEANHVPTRTPAGVERISDGSVDGDGAEFVVLPAITKSPRFVLALLKDLVHAPKLNTNKSCGFHVHVSASNLSSLARMRQWAIATEHLALQIEDLAFKALPDARQDNNYCRRIVPLVSGTTFNTNKYDNSRRYHWLNVVEMFRPNGIRTIEVRLLGNTHRWKYLLAWTLFSMELARRGWDLANHPFDVPIHVDALGDLLNKIAKEIKPLEKKSEPVPQWVYDGFKVFGIEPDAWKRPLAKLSEAEADVRGVPRRFYSDNQATEPEPERDDDNDDSCPCGCGGEGRCEQVTHDDGDCDSAYCYPCHSNGDCAGLPRCERCIDDAHDANEDCQRSRCGTCHPQPRARPVTPVDPSPTTATEVIGSVTTPPAGALTRESMQAAINAMRDMRVDHASLQMGMYRIMHDAVMTGEGVARITYDESVNVAGSGVPANVETLDGRVWITSTFDPATFETTFHPSNVLPTLPEELALPMTDAERLASDARERAHTPPEGRALTVAEIERLNEREGQ
jgi:Putative amidoligase enzyme